MWAIELLEERESCLLAKISLFNDGISPDLVKQLQDELQSVQWGLTVLKMAMGHAGEKITLPKGG